MPSPEYNIGEFPSDESEYDRNSISPTFVRVLQIFDKYKIKSARIAIVGKLYTGGKPVSGLSIKVTRKDVQNAAQKHDLSYEEKWKALAGMKQTPLHITGISIRPL